MLKLKVDTGAQGNNILPLQIYGNMFPEDVDDNGLPTGTTPTQTKLTTTWSLFYQVPGAHMVARKQMQGFMLLMSMARPYVPLTHFL